MRVIAQIVGNLGGQLEVKDATVGNGVSLCMTARSKGIWAEREAAPRRVFSSPPPAGGDLAGTLSMVLLESMREEVGSSGSGRLGSVDWADGDSSRESGSPPPFDHGPEQCCRPNPCSLPKAEWPSSTTARSRISWNFDVNSNTLFAGIKTNFSWNCGDGLA